ncbi:ImmA/IrrE family metallo-endopeptidase [Streptomyces sp. BA2]|uniref:ImmA/IrrE family metallo-endopeptidase n=1 Tax=Streptomyces sp. BA2 TaxID=436595 RepID=UPI001327B682|nr:ImmA/IrrE family metallo-endopeptidase [Streptomyces sp. BA2]
MSAFDPEAEIEQMGIPIYYLNLQDTIAAWDAEHRKVYCTLGLSSAQRRSALCHELGHITLGHRECMFGGSTPVAAIVQERSAELWAARKLISVVELAIARDSGLPRRTIAQAYGVTERMYHARLLAEEEDERRWLSPLDLYR